MTMKTIEELTALKKTAVENVAIWVKTAKDANATAKDKKDADDNAKKSIDAYNGAIVSNAHEVFTTAENPVKDLLTSRLFTGKIKVEKKVDKETGIVESAKVVDDIGFDPLSLDVLDAFAADNGKTSFCSDDLWHSKVVGLKLRFCAAATKAIGGDMKKFHNAFRCTKDIIGETRNKEKFDENFSKNYLKELSQQALDAILFEQKERFVKKGEKVSKYFVTSEDVNWMILAMCKLNRTDDIVMPADDTFIRIFTRVASKIIGGNAYDIEYQEPKD